MIVFPRVLARLFRGVLRRSLMDQGPRSPWPTVLCRAGKDGLVLQASQGDVSVRYHVGGACPAYAIAFGASALAEFEGRRDDPVQLEQVSSGNWG